jgi:hypothetical protein
MLTFTPVAVLTTTAVPADVWVRRTSWPTRVLRIRLAISALVCGTEACVDAAGAPTGAACAGDGAADVMNATVSAGITAMAAERLMVDRADFMVRPPRSVTEGERHISGVRITFSHLPRDCTIPSYRSFTANRANRA